MDTTSHPPPGIYDDLTTSTSDASRLQSSSTTTAVPRDSNSTTLTDPTQSILEDAASAAEARRARDSGLILDASEATTIAGGADASAGSGTLSAPAPASRPLPDVTDEGDHARFDVDEVRVTTPADGGDGGGGDGGGRDGDAGQSPERDLTTGFIPVDSEAAMDAGDDHDDDPASAAAPDSFRARLAKFNDSPSGAPPPATAAADPSSKENIPDNIPAPLPPSSSHPTSDPDTLTDAATAATSDLPDLAPRAASTPHAAPPPSALLADEDPSPPPPSARSAWLKAEYERDPRAKVVPRRRREIAGWVEPDLYGRGYMGIFGKGAEAKSAAEAARIMERIRQARFPVRRGDHVDYDVYGRADPRIFGQGSNEASRKEASASSLLKQRRAEKEGRKGRMVFPVADKRLQDKEVDLLREYVPPAPAPVVVEKVDAGVDGAKDATGEPVAIVADDVAAAKEDGTTDVPATDAAPAAVAADADAPAPAPAPDADAAADDARPKANLGEPNHPAKVSTSLLGKLNMFEQKDAEAEEWRHSRATVIKGNYDFEPIGTKRVTSSSAPVREGEGVDGVPAPEDGIADGNLARDDDLDAIEMDARVVEEVDEDEEDEEGLEEPERPRPVAA